MGWTNWERTAQRSPFFSSRIRTGRERGRGSACGMGLMGRRWLLGHTGSSPTGQRGCGLGGPGGDRRASKAGQPGFPPAAPRPLGHTSCSRCPPPALPRSVSPSPPPPSHPSPECLRTLPCLAPTPSLSPGSGPGCAQSTQHRSRASPRSWSLGLNTEYRGYGMYFSMPNVCVTAVVRLKKCWPSTTETLSLGGLCSGSWWQHDSRAPEVSSPPTHGDRASGRRSQEGDAVQGPRPHQALGKT